MAVPTPLARAFDYRLPPSLSSVQPGARVRVPFGRREVVGVALGVVDVSVIAPEKLKSVQAVLDAEPLWPAALLALLNWAAAYYHAPIGEVMQAALPVLLRRGADPASTNEKRYRVTAAGLALTAAKFPRAPLQWHLLRLLQENPEGLNAATLNTQMENWRAPLQRLLARDLIVRDVGPVTLHRNQMPAPPLVLNEAQRIAVAAMAAASGRFQSLLLHGVTGSGKTEVYLHAITRVVEQGGQALVLVPEIGLTPQLVERFVARLTVPVVVMHSALNDGERLSAWQAARSGQAGVVIGTRSAIFTPMPTLALIVIDEEHDASYKQQDGVRYHARDVAIKRARLENLPVVLGSATPSLESFSNAEQGRYQTLALPERTAHARPPAVQVLDLRRLKLHDGLSAPLVEALQAVLARGEQSLVFLNRRGFAPVLMCHDCGWLAPCKRCDARLTIHQRRRQLRCHHCGAEATLPERCPACASANLHGIGEGTERVEAALARLLPTARLERIDRDSTRRKGSLADALARVRAGAVDVLVGTQMLAKGHDFPNLTLVAVLNADQGLYSSDFRSEERLVQQLVQVAGRAGRADKPGTVLIQTYHPDNPVFSAIAHHDYREFAAYALSERTAAGYPPASHLALLRAESPRPQAALGFLQQARTLALNIGVPAEVTVQDAVPSAMERRAGRYRAQLLAQSSSRPVLHGFLGRWRDCLDQERRARDVRWSLDVDPAEMS